MFPLGCIYFIQKYGKCPAMTLSCESTSDERVEVLLTNS